VGKLTEESNAIADCCDPPFTEAKARPSAFRLPRFFVDRMTMDETVHWVVTALRQTVLRKPLLIVGPNAQLATLAERDERFSEALLAADLSVADGVSVMWASRLFGCPVPERVTGGELMERLCAEAAIHGFTVFFLGGLTGAAEEAAARLSRRYPGLKVAGTWCPPRGFESDPAETERIRQRIAQASPDLLCVAFGAPKQEIWMHEHCPTLPIRAAIAVGGALDTQAGMRHRAPEWTHRPGLEWLYRLLREPRRLWRRYLIGNPHFVYLILREWVSRNARFAPYVHAERRRGIHSAGTISHVEITMDSRRYDAGN
jgi:N-acetylglucosaminyldiphosphoundecaprenol N-acetyl-beta-D-mannosaminyltransferase